MRTLTAVLGFFCLACSAAPSSSVQTCEKLDADSKKALFYFVDDAYGLGQVRSEDAEELQWAHKIILKKGPDILPCLLEIYRHGVKGELWHGTGPAPTAGRWALPLIRAIDGPSAIPLYRELYGETADNLSRAQLASELVSLGDSEHLTEVVSFLEAPPSAASDRVADLAFARQRALAAIAAANYRIALPTLQKLSEDESVGDKHVLALYISQLSGDVEAVKVAVGDSRLRDTALLALKRMGKEEVLRQIAEDRANPAREAAALVLQGRLGR
jgi:hypothetical protein